MISYAVSAVTSKVNTAYKKNIKDKSRSIVLYKSHSIYSLLYAYVILPALIEIGIYVICYNLYYKHNDTSTKAT